MKLTMKQYENVKGARLKRKLLFINSFDKIHIFELLHEWNEVG